MKGVNYQDMAKSTHALITVERGQYVSTIKDITAYIIPETETVNLPPCNRLTFQPVA